MSELSCGGGLLYMDNVGSWWMLTNEGSCGQVILQCSSQPTHMWKNPYSELL